jgi:hypothetical protein
MKRRLPTMKYEITFEIEAAHMFAAQARAWSLIDAQAGIEYTIRAKNEDAEPAKSGEEKAK